MHNSLNDGEDSDWERQNIIYWNTIAPLYDALYTSRWSLAENEQIKIRLDWLRNIPGCRVLDLGCGTGLGYTICTELQSNLTYVGIDIAPEMIARCKERWPDGTFHEMSMHDLSRFGDNSFDVVISIFSGFSYSNRPERIADEIFRVLKPGGRLLLSALNRWAIRRLIKGQFARFETYHTRHAEKLLSGTQAILASRQAIIKLFGEAGFTEVRVAGQGIFSGWFEYYPIWWLNVLLSRLTPNLCHALLVTARRH